MKRVMLKFKCPKCGSEEHVLRDAYAAWNEDEQEWELHDVYDYLVCNACGADDLSFDEVCIEEEVDAAVIRKKQGSPEARAIVANLLWRKRMAKKDLNKAYSLRLSASMIDMYMSRHSEAHNSAEASRRILYGRTP